MFENRRRGRQARNFTTNAPKILDLKSSSEQIFSRKLPLGAPGKFLDFDANKQGILVTLAFFFILLLFNLHRDQMFNITLPGIQPYISTLIQM